MRTQWTTVKEVEISRVYQSGDNGRESVESKLRHYIGIVMDPVIFSVNKPSDADLALLDRKSDRCGCQGTSQHLLIRFGR